MLRLLHMVIHLKKRVIAHAVKTTYQSKATEPTVAVRQRQNRIVGLLVFDDAIIPPGYKTALDYAKDTLENAALSKAIEGMNFWNSTISIIQTRGGGKA